MFTTSATEVYRNTVKTAIAECVCITDEPRPWYVGLGKDAINPNIRRRLQATPTNGLIIYSLGFYSSALTSSEVPAEAITGLRGTLDSCPLSSSVQASGDCEPCPDHCLTCANAACTACEPGYYNSFS